MRAGSTRIDELLDDDDDYLIIVGALHLVGPERRAERLRNKVSVFYQLSEPPSLR